MLRHLSWNWERREADRGEFLEQPKQVKTTWAKPGMRDGMGGREWGGFGIWPEYNIWLNLTESHVG